MNINHLNKVLLRINGGKFRNNLPLTTSKLSPMGLRYFMFMLHNKYKCFPYRIVKEYDFGVITPQDLIEIYDRANSLPNNLKRIS